MQLEELSPAAWQQFASWFPNPPPYPEAAVFVSDGGRILAGVIYEESRSAVTFLSFTVNQMLEQTGRAKAAKFLLQICENLCKCRGRLGVFVGSCPDGWEPVPCGLLRKRPFQAVAHVEPVKTTPAPPPDPDDDDDEDMPVTRIDLSKKPPPTTMRKRRQRREEDPK